MALRRRSMLAGAALLMLAAPLAAEGGDQPVQQVEPTRLAHQLGDIPFNVQGVAEIVTIILGGLGIVTFFEKKRRQTEADAQRRTDDLKEAHRQDAERIERGYRERSDEIKEQLSDLRVSLGERVAKVETIVGDFVPRREIDQRFEHDKNGSLTRDKALELRIDAAAQDVRGLLVDVGALKQRQDGFGLSLSRIEELIRESNRDTSAKLDKMSETVNSILAKPPTRRS